MFAELQPPANQNNMLKQMTQEIEPIAIATAFIMANNSQINAVTDYMAVHNRNALAYAIRTAVALGIFEALEDGQKNAAQLAEATSANESVLPLLLDVLLNTELLEKYGDDYALSAVARMVPNRLMDFGDLHWCHLENFMRSGVSLPGNQSLAHTQADFLNGSAANEWMMTPAALDAAQVLDMGETRKALRILEVGSGSAIFGSTLLHSDNESRLVVLDDSANLKRARKTIESIEAQERVEFIEGDYLDFKLDSPPFDMVIATNLIHRHTEQECERLFKCVHSHLKTGGEFVVVDIFPGQNDGELTRSVVALEIVLRTEHGSLHDPARFQHTLIMNGFDQIRFAHLPAPPHIWGLILAQRN